MNNKPIGIFDSGVGGLTVARALLDILPQESLIYVGDTLHTPYGDKDLQTVACYSLEIMDRLVAEDVKILVIACNTASCAVLEEARERYYQRLGIPVVGMIDPAVELALTRSPNRRIGVLGTEATIMSGAYQERLLAAGAEVYSQACPKFVPFAEAGKVAGPEVMAATEEYLRPLRDADLDTLVLGCTHYPLLTGPISYFMGPKVQLVSSSVAAARKVYAYLVQNNLLAETMNPQHRFITTAKNDLFLDLTARIMGTHFQRSTDKEEIW